MGNTSDGFALIPAPDEPATVGRHIPFPGHAIRRGASALVPGGFLGGYGRKGMGGIAAGPLHDLLSVLAPAVVGGAGAVVVGWLNARNGRKVKVKVGDFEAEAGSAAELEKGDPAGAEVSRQAAGREG